MRLPYVACFLFLLGSVFYMPLEVLAQQPYGSDGMRVKRDSSGKVINAMYYKQGKPLDEWIYNNKSNKFKADLPPVQIIEYLNKELGIHLDVSLETAICLERTGDHYYKVDKDMKNTERFYLASVNMLEYIGNQSRAGYMYYYLGLLYYDWKKTDEADAWFRKAVKSYDGQSDNSQQAYAELLQKIFVQYLKKKDYKYAISYLEAYLLLGEKTKATAGQMMNVCLNLGDAYWNTERKPEALKVYPMALPFAALHFGSNSPEYFELAKKIADILFSEGYKKEAEPLYRILFDAEILRDNRKYESEICANLFICYSENGEFHKLLPVLERLEPLLSQNNAPGSKNNTELLELLAMLNEREGRYDITEKYLLQLIDIYKTKGNGYQADGGSAKLKLAAVYLKMYNIERAVLLADQGMAILEAEAAVDNNSLTIYLKIKGAAAMYDGDFTAAVTMLSKLVHESPRGGYSDIDYAVANGLLGLAYWYQKDYDKAETTLLYAIKIADSAKADSWREYANLNGNLALVYSAVGNYEKALLYTRSAMDTYKSLQGDNHPDYLTQKTNYSMYLEALGRNREAADEAVEANIGVTVLVDRNLLYWSENEMETFISGNITRFFDYYHSLYFRNIAGTPELAGLAYNNQLFLKGLLLNSSQKVQQKIASCTDDTLKSLADKHKQIRRQLEDLYASPPEDRKKDASLLEQQSTDLQKKIKHRLLTLFPDEMGKGSFLLADKTTYTDVRNSLKENEAAIEFLNLRYNDKVRETDSVFYCALVLTHNDTNPLFIYLTDESKLNKLLSLHPDQLYQPGSLDLFKEIWEPLSKSLEGVSKVYYSPSGLLHRVAFHAIPCSSTEVLSDKFLLSDLASTRTIMAAENPGTKTTSSIFGGIDYNTDTTILVTQAARLRNVADQHPTDSLFSRNLRGSAWSYLPGTRVEVEKISQLLNENNIPTQKFTGKEATEEALKALSGKSPSIIHIASHGFSIAKNEKSKMIPNGPIGESFQAYTQSQLPLMRTGLLFAGANNAWALSNPPAGAEDGILTAFELSDLDLSGTELVALSACETGLGDIRGAEGVFGLQRALFMSGVKNIIVSLWDVPDLETMELMDQFYSHLAKGISPEQAFLLSQDEMKSRYKEQPSLWAGFVFIR